MDRRPRRLLVLALAMAALAGGVARSAGQSDLIAFTGVRWSGSGSAVTQIYAIRADGTGLRRLTAGAGQAPAWSRDGSRLAFSALDHGFWRLVRTDAGGGHRRALTGRLNLADAPAWSPDGRRIAFEYLPLQLPMHGVLAQQVAVIGADGHGLRTITSFKGGAGAPAWSPDGRRVLVAARTGARDDARTDIWSVHPSGRGATRLLTAATDPAWSPDGTAIAFVRRGDVYTATAAGRDVRRLTTTKDQDGEPAWSPDGTRIAFATTHRRADPSADDMRLRIVDAGNGAALGEITDRDPGFWADAPAWRP